MPPLGEAWGGWFPVLRASAAALLLVASSICFASGNSVEDYVAEAKDLLEKGDAAGALSHCDIGTAYGTSPELHFVRGVAAANLGQYSRALLDIGKAKRAGFKTKRCDTLIKQIEEKQGKTESADEDGGARQSAARKAPAARKGVLTQEARAQINKSTDGALLLKMIEAMGKLTESGVHKLTPSEFITISDICRNLARASSKDGFREGVKAVSAGTVTIEQVQQQIKDEEEMEAARATFAEKAGRFADRITKAQSVKPTKQLSAEDQAEYRELAAESQRLGLAPPSATASEAQR